MIKGDQMGKSKSLTFLTQKPMPAGSRAGRHNIKNFTVEKSASFSLTPWAGPAAGRGIRKSRGNIDGAIEGFREAQPSDSMLPRSIFNSGILGRAVYKVGLEGRTYAWWKGRKRLSEGPQISEQIAFPLILLEAAALLGRYPAASLL